MMVLGAFGPFLLAVQAGADWTTEGRVVALDGRRSTVTLDHEPAGDVLPAARTEFPVARPELLLGVGLEDRVRVTLTAESDSHGVLAITRLERSAGPTRGGAADGSMTAMIAIGAAALLGALALWLETRRLRRSLAEASQSLLDVTRRQAAGQRKLDADVEVATQALGELARALAGQLASAAERVRLARSQRQEPETAPVPDGTLFIVRAGDVDTYRMLTERFSRPGLARVVWDRRRRDRRAGAARVGQERRRRERRGEPPPTWSMLGYVAVPPAPDRRLTSVA
jgi:hypothetical protein